MSLSGQSSRGSPLPAGCKPSSLVWGKGPLLPTCQPCPSLPLSHATAACPSHLQESHTPAPGTLSLLVLLGICMPPPSPAGLTKAPLCPCSLSCSWMSPHPTPSYLPFHSSSGCRVRPGTSAHSCTGATSGMNEEVTGQVLSLALMLEALSLSL